MLPPQAVKVMTQQEPNPAAQVPSAAPPRPEHSCVVRQVPLSPELETHAEFGKRTILNKLKDDCDNIPGNMIVDILEQLFAAPVVERPFGAVKRLVGLGELPAERDQDYHNLPRQHPIRQLRHTPTGDCRRFGENVSRWFNAGGRGAQAIGGIRNGIIFHSRRRESRFMET